MKPELVKEINNLVATKIMDWEFQGDSDSWWDGEVNDIPMDNWNPATDIKDAWLVVNQLSKRYDVNVKQKNGSNCECTLHEYDACEASIFEGEAPTASMAICIAALSSISIQIEELEVFFSRSQLKLQR